MVQAQWTPTGISFSSGGVRITGQLGALAKLMEAGVTKDVRDWYGCSGGSICALFGVIGVSLTWMRDAAANFDMRIAGTVEEDIVADVFTTWGVNSGKNMDLLLSKVIDTWEAGISTWTFADLAVKRPGSTLTIIATNLTAGKLTAFNAVNTPSVHVLDAIRASSAVPCFFTPWVDAAGDVYCDGAVLEYYPWNSVKDKDRTLVIACSDTNMGGREKSVVMHNLVDFISRVTSLTLRKNVSNRVKFWIAINNESVDPLDFQMSSEQRLFMFDEGRLAATRWLEFKQVLCSETQRNQTSHVSHHTSSSLLSPNRMSDTHQCHNPLPLRALSQHPHTESSRPSRRWSL